MENKEVKLVNCTPHAINLQQKDDSFTVIEPSGIKPTVETVRTKAESINGIDVHTVKNDSIADLPSATTNTVYIVSQLVASAVPQRRDLVFPLDLIRDDKGRIVGCRGFGQVPNPTIMCHRCNDTGFYQAEDVVGSLCVCSCLAGIKRCV